MKTYLQPVNVLGTLREWATAMILLVRETKPQKMPEACANRTLRLHAAHVLPRMIFLFFGPVSNNALQSLD